MTDNNKPLIIEREINAPVEKVWKALTDIQDLLRQSGCRFSRILKPRLVLKHNFYSAEIKTTSTRIFARLQKSLRGKNLLILGITKVMLGNRYVTYELFAQGGKTKLKLTHTITEDFPADNQDFALKNFAEGWNYTADGLKKFVENN